VLALPVSLLGTLRTSHIYQLYVQKRLTLELYPMVTVMLEITRFTVGHTDVYNGRHTFRAGRPECTKGQKDTRLAMDF